MNSLISLKVRELTLKEKFQNAISQEETYSFSEYKNLIEARENTEEYIAKKIMADPRLKKMSAFLLGSILYLNNAVTKVNASAPSVEAFDQKINEAGTLFVGIIQSFGYWMCIIMCAVEILKALFQGDTRSISKIIIKYLLAFSSVYAIPWIFDLIKALFS